VLVVGYDSHNLYESSQLDSTAKYALYKEIQMEQTLTNINRPRYTKRTLLPGENSQTKD